MSKYFIVLVAFLSAFFTDRGFPWWLSALGAIGFEVVLLMAIKTFVMMPMPTITIGKSILEGTIDA